MMRKNGGAALKLKKPAAERSKIAISRNWQIAGMPYWRLSAPIWSR